MSIYEQIKKQNGEAFAKAIRNYDNGIFDIPDIIDIVKYAGREAEPIMNYLVSLKNIRIEEHGTCKDPISLLKKAGYNAYYADTLEKQNAIRKYYAPGEELCTFRDPERFKNYYIINAVRKDVDKIKRGNFEGKEEREDKYGTSVLSIQILKKGGFISIKNRYNHTVKNPDNTLYSNPDNIILGLSSAIKNFFGVDFSAQDTRLPPNYVVINDQIIKYNYEKNNTYFGPDFYIKNGIIHPLDKDKEIMLDTYILNLKDRTLQDPSINMLPVPIDNEATNELTDIKVLCGEFKNKKINITKNKDGSHNIYANGNTIVKVRNGKIIGLNLPTAKKIDDVFLHESDALREFSAPELEEVGNHFLYYDFFLEKFNAPKLRRTGNDFLTYNEKLMELYTPLLEKVGDNFLCRNDTLEKLELANLKETGSCFLRHTRSLTSFKAPKLEKVGYFFLACNSLTELSLPKLKEAGSNFLTHEFQLINKVLTEFYAPELRKVEDNFLCGYAALEKLDFPKLEETGRHFLNKGFGLIRLTLPCLKKLGAESLMGFEQISHLEAPYLSATENLPPNMPQNVINLLRVSKEQPSRVSKRKVEETLVQKLSEDRTKAR